MSEKQTTITMTEIVTVPEQQYTDIPSTLRAIAAYGDRSLSLFKTLLSYVNALLLWEIENDIPQANRMTPADLGNYFRDILGAQFTAYRLKGERIVPDPEEQRKPLYEVSKTVSNLVSMLNRKTAEMARIVGSTTVKELDDNTRAVKVEKPKPKTLVQAVEQETKKVLKQAMSKLFDENAEFRGEVTILLKRFGADIKVELEEVTTFKRKAKK